RRHGPPASARCEENALVMARGLPGWKPAATCRPVTGPHRRVALPTLITPEKPRLRRVGNPASVRREPCVALGRLPARLPEDQTLASAASRFQLAARASRTKRVNRATAATLRPAISPSHRPAAPMPRGNASHQPIGMPIAQYDTAVSNAGTFVSL